MGPGWPRHKMRPYLKNNQSKRTENVDQLVKSACLASSWSQVQPSIPKKKGLGPMWKDSAQGLLVIPKLSEGQSSCGGYLSYWPKL
jgi:hypothetical protein